MPPCQQMNQSGDVRDAGFHSLEKEKGVLGCGAYPRTPSRSISDRPSQDTVSCGVTPSELISVEGKQLVVSVRVLNIW